MDAIVRIQIAPGREGSSRGYAGRLRAAFARDGRSGDLELSFNTGGLIRGSMSEGKSTPVSIRATGKDLAKPAQIAARIGERVARIDGVVDAVIVQRQNYPEYVINVDRTKAADLGRTQVDAMQNVIASLNSSISFNKRNFWIDPRSRNQYFAGVQYPEKDITSVETMLDIPITGPLKGGRPCRSGPWRRSPGSPSRPRSPTTTPSRPSTSRSASRGATSATSPTTSPGRSTTSARRRAAGGGRRAAGGGVWTPYDPATAAPGGTQPMEGARIVLSGEYTRMQATFRDLAVGMVLAVLLMYFLMVALGSCLSSH